MFCDRFYVGNDGCYVMDVMCYYICYVIDVMWATMDGMYYD